MKTYFDAAATTPLDDRVKAVMQENFEIFGNENSKHFYGFESRKMIDDSLKKMGNVLGVPWSELAIVYSGTDGNRRFVWECRKRFGQKNLYGSAVEHSSIRDEILPENMFDPLGDFSDIPANAKMISLMAANSETGTVFSAKNLRKKFPESVLHQDYVQAVGKIPVKFEYADAITFAPHKFYGPKMVGLLWLKNPQIFPEISKDSHTKNPWIIAGMAKSFELLADGKLLSGSSFQLSSSVQKIKQWQIQIETFIQQKIPRNKIRHKNLERIPGIINVSFEGIRGGALAQILSSEEKICVSTGSACTSDILQPTDTITFFESDPIWQFPIRISLHTFLDDESVHDFCEILFHYVQELRTQ